MGLDGHLATKQDIALLRANIWRVVLSAAAAALVVNRFLAWIIP